MVFVLGFERGDRVLIGDEAFGVDGDARRLVASESRVVPVVDKPAPAAAGVSVFHAASVAARWNCWLAVAFDGPN